MYEGMKAFKKSGIDASSSSWPALVPHHVGTFMLKTVSNFVNSPIGGERVANTTHPHSMHFIQTNVAKEEDWEQLMENTLSKWGRVDILVNNAGTSYKNKVNSSSSIFISIPTPGDSKGKTIRKTS